MTTQASPLRSYIKIDCSSFSNLVAEQKEDHPWAETNCYSNIAVNIFLGLDPTQLDNRWPPRGYCVKSSSTETLYPELKERVGGKKFDYYILSVVDTKTKIVFLEGWIDYETLTQEKNLFKNSYIVSFKDLFSMQDLKCQ
jgi:hypothetical protein